MATGSSVAPRRRRELDLDGVLVDAADDGEGERASRPGLVERLVEGIEPCRLAAGSRDDEVALLDAGGRGGRVGLDLADEQAVARRQADRGPQPAGDAGGREADAEDDAA